MRRWFMAGVTGILLAGTVFSQDETNLVLRVDSLSGREVSGTWPYIAGVGVNFAAKTLDTADVISAKVKLVGVAPTTGKVQAMVYIKTGSNYQIFDEGVYTDLVANTWVEVKSRVKNMVADSLTRVLELGIKFTTSQNAVYSGQIKIDDVVIKKASGNVVIANFTEGLMGWHEIQFGELGRVIKDISVPGVTAEPAGRCLMITVDSLDDDAVVDEDLGTPCWPYLGGVGRKYGSTGTNEFKDAKSISVQLKVTGGTIASGSEVQARIYLKTGDWKWSTTSSYTNLKLDKWVTLNVPVGSFDDTLIKDITNVNEIGLQFQTYGAPFSGNILLDDVVVKQDGKNDTLFNFEFGTENWSEQQVTGNQCYTSGRIVKNVTIYPPISNVGTGGAMYASFFGLSGESVTTPEGKQTWPYQCGIAINLNPNADFTGKNRISILLAPEIEILPGTELRAQFYVKASGNWTYSEGPYMPLKGQQWNLLEAKVKEFSPPIQNLKKIQSIGIKFYTQQMEYSGKVYFDDLKYDSTVIYNFDDALDVYDWKEDDMGQILKSAGGTIFDTLGWVETVTFTGVGVSAPRCLRQNTGFTVLQSDRLIRVSFALTTDRKVTLAVYDIAGREVLRHLIQAKAGSSSVLLDEGRVMMSKGIYTVTLKTGDGILARRICIVR